MRFLMQVQSYTALLSLLAFSLAPSLAVVVDDTDPSIHYTPDTGWYLYTSVTDPEFSWLDDPRVYNGSLHRTPLFYSNCTVEDDCHARFTFTGIGITVHNVIRSTINVNMSIDQGPWTNFVFEDNLSCLNTDPAHYTQACYNRSTYISGPLTYGEHTLDIWMIGGDANHFNYADYFLDHLDVNDTNPNPPATTTRPPQTSTETSSITASGSTASVRTAHHRNAVGAAVGGTIGALVLIAIVLLLLLRRRRRSSVVGVVEPDPAFTPSPFSTMVPTAASDRSNSTPRLPPTSKVVPSPGRITTTGSAMQTSSVAELHSPVGSGLSAGQTEFVHDLYRMNVPSTAVAGVISRMLQEDASSPTTVFASTRTDDDDSIQLVPPPNPKDVPPPTYEP